MYKRQLERNTNETQIELTLNLDGAGRYEVDTGCGFLNHMLGLFARHGPVSYTHLASSEPASTVLSQASSIPLGEDNSTDALNAPFETCLLYTSRCV